MDIFNQFAKFWNRLALKNDKVKFRTEREAEKFIRNLVRESGGPNEEMMRIRREYEAVQNAKRYSCSDRSHDADGMPV